MACTCDGLCLLLHTSASPLLSLSASSCLQSIAVRDMINSHVAHAAGLAPSVVQEANFYQVGQTTPFGDVIGSANFNWTIPTLWARIKASVEYEERVKVRGRRR